MDKLKSIFACSSDNVIITDYSFNILWHNKEGIFSFYGQNCSALFEKEQLPLASGTYCISHRGLFYECKVINYPDCENGVYVISTDNNDVMYSFVNCKGVKEVIINYSGAVRSAVSGIALSNDKLRKILLDSEKYEELEYNDITAGNCCKLLNTSTNILELINYADGNYKSRVLDLTAILGRFARKSADVLRNKVIIEINAEPKLYINADPDRLEIFLISMIIAVYNASHENNVINVTAEKIQAENGNEYISLTASASSSGTDMSNKKFYEHLKLYSGSEYDTTLLVINRFCKVFGGTLYISDKPGEASALSVRLPLCKLDIILETSTTDYNEGFFTKYRIMYSDILY